MKGTNANKLIASRIFLSRVMILFIWFVTVIHALGQQSVDTINLKGLKVTASRFDLNNGFKSTAIDSTILAGNGQETLSTLLDKHSTAHIKSYGPGNISTISFRGTQANHTQLYWNGLRLNSPLLGQADLSLLPNYFYQRITLLHGGSSLIAGSGGIGGGILLDNFPEWDKKLSININQSIGSFNTFNSTGSMHLGNKRIQSRTSLIFASSRNDYSYVNQDKPGNPREKRQNASWQNQGFQQGLHIITGTGQYVSLIIWSQWNQRDIPKPTVIDFTGNQEYQDQQFAHAILQWKSFRENRLLHARAGYSYDHLNYINEGININSKNTTHSTFAEFIFAERFARFLSLKGGVRHDMDYALTVNFDSDRSYHKTGIWGNISLFGQSRFNLDILFRQEYINGSFSPFLPAVALSYALTKDKYLFLKGNVAMNYKVPTMNDLYWKYDGYSSGNPDLGPEKGFSADLGPGFNRKFNDISLQAGLTGFYNEVENMIQWTLLTENTLIWKPVNLRKVRSGGIESYVQASIPFGNSVLSLSANYALTKSTNVGKIDESDQSEGKQLVYIPLHKVNGVINYNFRFLRVSSVIRYFSETYTTTDNTRELPSYALQDVTLEGTYMVRNYKISLQFRLNNIWNRSYQVVDKQPMPGKNFMITVKFYFNKP